MNAKLHAALQTRFFVFQLGLATGEYLRQMNLIAWETLREFGKRGECPSEVEDHFRVSVEPHESDPTRIVVLVLPKTDEAKKFLEV